SHLESIYNLKRCLQALVELEEVPVTSQILHKNADVIATLKKIRRYKASNAVMEKASEVYNKLKLRFVVKGELPTKPKSDDKESQDNGKGSQNTDSTPMNGESEQKQQEEDVEEEKPKSLTQEENDQHTTSSPKRYLPVSYRNQCS
uniref:Lens epithelium-derived growth factor integrase-binding domain-containing protein n=1 Tax=Gadus morhua TaxID=8049 RepID=A0A8C5BS91_GADMO